MWMFTSSCLHSLKLIKYEKTLDEWIYSILLHHSVHKIFIIFRTLDSQNFRPIVSISAVESYESANINLVAVSQTGVRFYLSVVSLSNLQPNQRPYMLSLMHVRLPPGYSANITVRPRSVHTANYRDRNLVLISTVNEKDVIWCMSSDLFPFTQSLMEAYTAINLDGPALAISEVGKFLTRSG